MKIAVLSAWNAPFEGLARITVPNRIAYCERWGYEFVGVPDWTGDRHPQWARLDAARSVLPRFDAVMMMDLDAVITNPEIRIEDLLGPEDFYVTDDWNGLNNGMMLIRNTPWACSFLNKVWETGPRYAAYPNPDQSTLTGVLICEPKDKWAIRPQRTMNSFPYDLYGIDYPSGQWQPGDFIYHVPALPVDRRMEVLASVLGSIRPPATEKTDLTVIVVSWKRPHLLKNTLASIKSKLGGLTARVIVADNESSPETRAVIEEAGVDYWPIPLNRGINWPVEKLLGPVLDSEFVCVSDHDIHYGRDFSVYLDFLRANPDVAFAKGLDSPEHAAFGEREFGGEKWILKKVERGGGVIMKTETLQAAFPLPHHPINFDWHLCSTGGVWAILKGTYAHTGYRDSTREGMIETPETHILVDGQIVPNPSLA